MTNMRRHSQPLNGMTPHFVAVTPEIPREPKKFNGRTGFSGHRRMVD
jgi:hypothetical protein